MNYTVHVFAVQYLQLEVERVAHVKSEVGTETIVMTYRQGMHELRNMHLTHLNF